MLLFDTWSLTVPGSLVFDCSGDAVVVRDRMYVSERIPELSDDEVPFVAVPVCERSCVLEKYIVASNVVNE